MKVCRQFLVSGRVQGVGFRAFTLRAATKFAIEGWVRNLADGRVEAIAVASREKLIEFEARVKKGPLASRVENLIVKDVNYGDDLGLFVMLDDGEAPWPAG